MSRRSLKGRAGKRSATDIRMRERFHRLAFETLEDRTMLDSGAGSSLAAAIVVGRALSVPGSSPPAPSYFVGEVQNNQVTITYTAYNEEIDPETGLLLTTTLGPGVTVASASPQPDFSGNHLAWSLGTITGFGRASVTLTVDLAGPSTTQLDTGAHVFATVDAGAVSNSTPAATLRMGNVSDPSLLASTPDANTTDPYIQEEAAKLSYDPQQIFNYLHTQVSYNSYTGSVRGARGTLWSSAGNALDVASLGVALMRASGIPAQYQQGALSFNQAQQLILSMFPASYQTVGFVPSGTQTADPADNGQLLNETENHYWFQFDSGGGMKDADPLMAGATIGQTFTTSSGSFAQVPDALREKTEIQLNAEVYSTAGALFGAGISTSTVLDMTFNDVDLVGRPLTIGNFVSSSSIGALIFSSTTNNYTPYVDMGDFAFPPSHDEVTPGTPYQEVLTNFPLGTQVLTGLFLDVTLSGPQGAQETYSRTLVDRIGAAARAGLTAASPSIDPSAPPILSEDNVFTLNVMPSLTIPAAMTSISSAVTQDQAVLAAEQNADPTTDPSVISDVRQAMVDLTRLLSVSFMAASDKQTEQLAAEADVTAYFDRPRLILVSSPPQLVNGSTPSTLNLSVDLRNDSVRALPFPGQNASAGFAFNFARGLAESALESIILQNAAVAGNPQPISTLTVFQAATAANIPFGFIGTGNLSLLDTLNISANAKAQITATVQSGNVVFLPLGNVTIGSVSTTAWYQINPNTGETIGVTEDGGHQALVEYAVGFAAVAFIATTILVGPVELYLRDNPPILQQAKNLDLQAGQGALYAGALILGLVLAFELVIPLLLIGGAALFGGGLSLLFVDGTLDPPVSPLLSDLHNYEAPPRNLASQTIQVGPGQGAGQILASGPMSGVVVSGPVDASWSSTSETSYQAQTLAVSGGTILNAAGQTVGAGPVGLNVAAPIPLAVAGNTQSSITGTGSLSFYGPAESALGVSGDWTSYSATLTGNVAISLTTDSLSLNGHILPAGTYTIVTTSATLVGSGATSSPNFSGSAAITATGGTIELGPGTETLSAGGKPIDSKNETTLTGWSGTINISAAGNGTDTVVLNGNAANVLTASGSPTTLTTDQNTPVTFQANVQTSFADNYAIKAQAPAGWTVSIGANGKITATPAPGVQSGTYPIQVIAQSTTNSELVTQTTVNVTITPTTAAITLNVAPDPEFEVPYQGAELPTAFRASIRNLGPTTDTYNVSVANVPFGFTLLASGTSITIPAGQTGFIGLYLQPNAGQPLPAPGTVLSFMVTATSATNAQITKTQTENFIVPAINALAVTSTPVSLNTLPGVGVTDTITITNVGNVPETNIALAATLPGGLTATGLAPLTLAVGQSATEIVTFTPSASTPLGSTLGATITATFGPSTALQTQSLSLSVDVVAPGVQAIANASVAAQQLGNTGLVGRLNDLSTALTNLVQNPTSAVYQGQALANLDSLISQLTNDPILSSFTSGLTTARTALAAASSASDVQAAVTNLGSALGSLAAVITDDAEHQFTLALSPDREIVQPGAPEVFSLLLTNNGTVATTYDLSVSGLPAGVASAFSQTSVTIQPGQSITANDGVTLTLTESGDTLVPANFTVTATAEGAAEIAQSTPGLLTLRNESILVPGVIATPSIANPGALVDVSAQIQAAVNELKQVSASYTVTDSTGTVLFTSPAVPFALTVSSGLTTIDLGNLDTTGFADGVDIITVNLSSGASGSTTLFVGQPVTGSLSTTPAVVPTGSDTVTTTISVTTQATYPAPLTLQGAVTTPAPGTSVALYASGGKIYAYESGTGGIDALDITDPTNPQLLEVFGQNDITNGQFGFNIAKVVNGELIVGTSNGNNGSVFNLLVYSLADPANPTSVSNTTINYRFLSDLLVNSMGTAAYVPTNGFFYSGNTIDSRFGDFVSIDLSDPTQPALAGSLFNDQGQPDGGVMSQYGGTLVNDQIAYSAGITPGGGTVIGNTGNLLVVNIADPKNMSLIEQLPIPGTINIVNVAVQGNRALVVGSTGTESSTVDFNATGVANYLTLTLLDITNPSDPKILGSTFVTSEQFPVNEAGAKTDVVSLGDGDFAVSDTDANGNPALLVVDPSNPSNIIVGAAQVPSGVHGITVSGNLLYASTSNGLSIYEIQPLVSDPVSITVNLPAGTAANIVPGSFNVAPTQINTSANGDSLVWNRSFASGNTTFTFNWQTTLSGIQAGQSIPVTTGAAVSYVNQGTPGALTLPGTSVTGVQIISITPATLTEQPGGSATYDVRLTNPTDATVTYNLSTSGLSAVDANMPNSVTVPAQGIVDVPLTLTSFTFTPVGNESFTVTAEYVLFAPNFSTQLGDFKGTASSSLTIAGQPVVQPDTVAHGIVVSLTPSQAVLGQQGTARYIVHLTNVGSADDQFNLAVTGLPNDVFASFGQNAFDFDVPPGAGNFRDVILTLSTSFGGAAPGSFPFTVTATSSSVPAVSGSTVGTVTVVTNGVNLALDPSSSAAGSPLQLTVTNTGTVSDTFDLALVGPAALVATLAVRKVTLAPGASQVVSITTTVPGFAVPGPLDLTAIAISEDNKSVIATASSSLTVAESKGLTASLSPGVKVLPIPGTTSFVLIVTNTGNTLDLYTLVITGVNGPVTAHLVGLNGSPTQSIPVLRLPALSTAAIVIDTDLATAGAGTVTVQVRSLSDSALTATATAQVSAGSVPAVDGPKLLTVARYGIHWMPTTLVLTFSQPLNPLVAENPGNYVIIDPHGHRVAILSAIYDPTTRTVTLHPARRLDFHYRYKLTVNGASSNGLTNLQGLLLDGNGDGTPGGNYVTVVNRHNLVWNAPTPKISRFPTPRASKAAVKARPSTAANAKVLVKAVVKPVHKRP